MLFQVTSHHVPSSHFPSAPARRIFVGRRNCSTAGHCCYSTICQDNLHTSQCIHYTVACPEFINLLHCLQQRPILSQTLWIRKLSLYTTQLFIINIHWWNKTQWFISQNNGNNSKALINLYAAKSDLYIIPLFCFILRGFLYNSWEGQRVGLCKFHV